MSKPMETEDLDKLQKTKWKQYDPKESLLGECKYDPAWIFQVRSFKLTK